VVWCRAVLAAIGARIVDGAGRIPLSGRCWMGRQARSGPRPCELAPGPQQAGLQLVIMRAPGLVAGSGMPGGELVAASPS
jgi:hypothetical protein